jgi:hypothetical protein
MHALDIDSWRLGQCGNGSMYLGRTGCESELLGDVISVERQPTRAADEAMTQPEFPWPTPCADR